MIPWATFNDRAIGDVPDQVRIQLHEHWLLYVEYGPTMTTVFMNSPMLEIAHERQFVVSQQGGESVGFEVDHAQRIGRCLEQLDHHFHAHAIDVDCQPSSPGAIDLECCWMPSLPRSESPSLFLSQPSIDSVHYSESPVVPARIPAASSSMLSPTKPTITLEPEVDSSESDLSDEVLKKMRLNVQRAGGTLPVRGIRGTKGIRQRRRYDSKLVANIARDERKRGSEWMIDEQEDDIAVAERSQSIASLKTDHRPHRGGADLGRIIESIDDT